VASDTESFVSFPFPENRFPDNLGVAVASTALRGEQPVRYVAHTPDNDWWLSDGVTDPNDADAHVVAHIRHVLDRDPTVEILATLPLAHEARRDGVDDDWRIGPFAWAADA
jgi:hypothetical protein